MTLNIRHSLLTKRRIAGAILIIAAGAVLFFYLRIFGAPQRQAERVQFIIPVGEKGVEERMVDEGFIRSAWALHFALQRTRGNIKPGGYELSKAMDVWEIARVLTYLPALVWVTIPEGLRKEETAEILAAALGWRKEEKEKWVSTYTAMKYEYVEGVYFPDTYLIPIAEKPFDTAERLRKNFETKFAPFAEEALAQNIKWDTVVKIASLLEREAAGSLDKPLIAGIIWNRLLQGMRLEIDATLQYARGDMGRGWWAPITPQDKQIDSRYNTYKYKGLPPHPIANPGLAAINAVLHREETDCLFYLHDRQKVIHCAKTYEEHKQNIETYLR